MQTNEFINLTLAGAFNAKEFIQLQAMFWHDNTLYFVFPWAEQGNLRQFWRNAPPRDRDGDTPWVLDQILRIVNGLQILNGKNPWNFRHGDLKPENILVFNDPLTPGKLVIGDLGLSKIHISNTARRDYPTDTIWATRRYLPPEENAKKTQRSRAYDIWTMGCICFEFMNWLLFGSDENELYNERNLPRFYHLDEGASWEQAERHPNVTRGFQSFRTEIVTFQNHKALDHFLNLIENRLLAINYKDGGITDGDKRENYRAELPEVHEQLRHLLNLTRYDTNGVGPRIDDMD